MLFWSKLKDKNLLFFESLNYFRIVFFLQMVKNKSDLCHDLEHDRKILDHDLGLEFKPD